MGGYTISRLNTQVTNRVSTADSSTLYASSIWDLAKGAIDSLRLPRLESLKLRIEGDVWVGHQPIKSALRMAWINQFDSTFSERGKDALRILLRKSFADHSSASSKWAFNHTTTEASYIGNSLAIPEFPILVPIMVDGYYFASSVGHVLDNKRKPFDFAMIGCHREDNTFKSMKIEPYKVYIREIDETFLHENRTRPMLLLDDTCATGKTIGAVLNYMIKIDCTNIFLASQTINYTPEGFALVDPAGGVGLYKAK